MKRLPFVDRVSLGLGNALSVLFLVAVLLTVYEVVMRYAFNAPTIWVHDMVIVLSAVCFIFGGPLASQQRSHIQMASYFDKTSQSFAVRWINSAMFWEQCSWFCFSMAP